MNRIIRYSDRSPEGDWIPQQIKCDCGEVLEPHRPGADVGCEKCQREYNSSGQELAPRSQWGEETGEHASDYDAGFNDPERAFD